MPSSRIEADYLLETAGDPSRVAELMAGEQSSGTFVAVPGETEEVKARVAAQVARLRLVDEVVTSPSLPSARVKLESGTRFRRVHLTLSWPLDTLGPSLPNLLATIAGNLFELNPVTGLRLLDIRLPEQFATAYPGPRFGVSGTRRLAGVEGRPLIGTIIKPSVGLGPEQTAALVGELCHAGIDFIKDDELQSDGPACPFNRRVEAVMRVINDHAQRSGKKVMYAFNLTGDLEQMRRRHCKAWRDLPHGEPQFRRSCRDARTRAFQPTADPCASQWMGLFIAPSAARLVVYRLAKDLASRRRRSHARKWRGQ